MGLIPIQPTPMVFTWLKENSHTLNYSYDTRQAGRGEKSTDSGSFKNVIMPAEAGNYVLEMPVPHNWVPYDVFSARIICN